MVGKVKSGPSNIGGDRVGSPSPFARAAGTTETLSNVSPALSEFLASLD